MATKRINALTAASAAALTDQIPIEDNANNTRKLTITQLFALLDDTAFTWTAAQTFSSTVGVTGNFAVNTNKFTVAAASGNTAIAGTLTLGGDAILSRSGANELTTSGALVIGSTGYVTTSMSVGSLSAPTRVLDVTGTFGATGAATLGNTLAVAGNASVNGGALTLGNGTSNWVDLGAVGAADPSFTTRSAGTKLILYNTIDGSSCGLSLGVATGATHMFMGCSQATASYGFKWFGGTTEIASLNGAGVFSTAAAIRSTGSAVPTSGAGIELSYASGNCYVEAYDRGGSSALPLRLFGSDVATNCNLTIGGGGVLILGAYMSPGGTSTKWTSGSGTPEGAVTAVVGSLYTRTDGGAGTVLYVKETGSGNTGWVAYTA